MKTQRLASLFVIIGAVFIASSAHAQGKPAPKPADAKPAADAKPTAAPATADPKQKYANAVKKFNANDFAGALADFQELDSLKSTPQSSHYIALSLDKLGRYSEALTAYDKFLASPGKMTKEADEAKKRVEEIKKMPAKLHVETTPPGATITVDGKPSGSSPAEVELAPGKHMVHVELAGYDPLDKDVDAAPGAKTELKTELSKKPEEKPVANTPPPPVEEKPAEPPPPPPAKPKSKLPAIITGGLAVVALGFGTGFGIAALGNKSDFDKNPNASSADAGENNALIADMMFGVAITLGVTSAVLFFTKDDDDAKPNAQLVPAAPKKARVTVTPAPIITPHGGGAGAVVRF